MPTIPQSLCFLSSCHCTQQRQDRCICGSMEADLDGSAQPPSWSQRCPFLMPWCSLNISFLENLTFQCTAFSKEYPLYCFVGKPVSCFHGSSRVLFCGVRGLGRNGRGAARGDVCSSFRIQDHYGDRDTPDSFVPSSSPESVVGMEVNKYPDLSLVKEEPPEPVPSPIIPILPSISGRGTLSSVCQVTVVHVFTLKAMSILFFPFRFRIKKK